jgi:uncharacterized protein with FMN-binding domain
MSVASNQRIRRVAGLAGLLGTAVVLVAGKAATAPPTHRIVLSSPSTPPPAGPSPGASKKNPGTSTKKPTPARGAPTRSTAPAGPRTVLGRPQDNPYGTVQVKVTLAGGRITDVQAVQMPAGGRSGDIAAYAAPQLRSEVLSAQSANIDTVSGASYDSEGYARSVQSALDAAPR